jgi:hypothetical protein
MVSEQRFNCRECGEQFTINGNWFNQLFYSKVGNLKFYIHCFKKHREKILSKPYAYWKIVKEAFLIGVLIILTMMLKIIWIVTLPFAAINEITS